MISVAIATYNGEKYLSEQLNSICEQSMLPDEIVISDDCSTDDTIKIIEWYKDKYSGIKFVILKNKFNIGFAKNFLNAIINTNGDVIFLSDQDDIWYEDKIKIMYNALFTSDSNLVFSKLKYMDKNGSDIDIKHIFDSSLKYCIEANFFKKKYIKYDMHRLLRILNLTGMTFAFKNYIRDILKKLISNKEFVDNLKFHDVLVSYLGLSNDKDLLFLNEILTKYRLHEKNTIGISKVNHIKFDRKEWIKILNENQKFLLLVEKQLDENEYNLNLLNKFISVSSFRLNLFDKPSIIGYLKLLMHAKYCHSLKSILGDMLYTLKKL